jgi:hypothetical protein
MGEFAASYLRVVTPAKDRSGNPEVRMACAWPELQRIAWWLRASRCQAAKIYFLLNNDCAHFKR